ncbi:MAG: hypothetical protein JSW60_05115 [Thermoplasmatales archaeon]|nr:MAG: hypothetical protein JSW60_05115 [Thermoplasmatales archaeon]
MVLNKLYEIGQHLGLNKIDIDNVLSTPTWLTREIIKSTPPLEIYKEFGRYSTVSIHDFQEKGNLDIIPDKLYELGRCFGLDKKDIDNVYLSYANKEGSTRVNSPLEVYKGTSHYGTISIKDF